MQIHSCTCTCSARADPGIFDWGGGGGGGLQTLLNSERTVETFLWQIACNRDDQVLRRLLLAQEILLCKQRRTDHRRVPKKQLHF